MTGTGDDTQLDFQESSVSPQGQPPESAEVPSPLGASLEGLFEAGTLGLEDLDEGMEASIFDDEPSGPMDSMEDVPDAIPNISDGGTEILKHGRAELQEFTEGFVENADTGPSAAPGINGLDDFAESPTVIINLPTIDPSADTVKGESPFRSISPSESTSALASDSSIVNLDDSTVDLPTEDSVVDLPISTLPEETGEGGLSLSDISTVSAVVGAAAVSASSTLPKKDASSLPGGNRTLLMALGGYAVLVTLLCLLLLSLLAKARNASRLESLPDLPPEPRGKMSLVPMQEDLPPGHTLAIGESQRFGHLRVEPIKVTRGSFQAINTSADTKKSSFNSEAETGPVLKLWVKFTNESPDQTFAPLDAGLLYRRREVSLGTFQGNQFVVPKSDRGRGDSSVLVYKPYTKDWELTGQQLGQPLEPGQSIETYIPTDENGIDDLKGDLLWRVQLRKGLARSGNGVTTVVEVAFRSDQIESEGG